MENTLRGAKAVKRKADKTRGARSGGQYKISGRAEEQAKESQLICSAGVQRETMRSGESDVLHINLRYPEFSGAVSVKFLKRLNGFYSGMIKNFLQYCKRTLFRQAVFAYEKSKKDIEIEPAPEKFKPFGAVVTYELTYNRGNLCCICIDFNIYAGKGRGKLARQVTIWDTRKRILLSPSSFVTLTTAAKKRVRSYIGEIMRIQTEKGEEYYQNTDPSYLMRHIKARNIFITDKGFAFFFPQDTIASSDCGIVSFIVPERVIKGEQKEKQFNPGANTTYG